VSDVKITANAPGGYTNGLTSVGCHAGMMSEIHAKANQHCRSEYSSLMIWNDLTQELIATDSDRILLQLVDILKSLFKYTVGSWRSSLKRFNC